MDALTLEKPRREALRGKLLAETPWWYSPWVHLAFPSCVGIGLAVAAGFQIHDLRPLELLILPILFVISNAAEWRAHRDLLHKRTRFMELLFDRHTPEHHAIYVCGDLTMRSRNEFRLVLI